jgi:hypothetical protein
MDILFPVLLSAAKACPDSGGARQTVTNVSGTNVFRLTQIASGNCANLANLANLTNLTNLPNAEPRKPPKPRRNGQAAPRAGHSGR